MSGHPAQVGNPAAGSAGVGAAPSTAAPPTAGAGIGYRQLWAADPGDWRAAGRAWGALTGLAQRRRSSLDRQAGTLRTAWAGGAASAADHRLGGLGRELTALAPAMIEAEQTLAEFARRVQTARARLDAAVASAQVSGVRVDRDGRVSAGPAPAPGPVVAGVARALRDALDLAGTADREAAARLAALSEAAHTGWVDPPPPDRPWPGASPAAVRAWWSGLTAAERRWLVTYEPERVGGLDGIPAAARDQANRLRLDAVRDELLAERARLLLRVPRGPVEAVGLLRVEASLAGLTALTGRLDAPEAPRAYLLGIDPAGEGRAVVALGNPDRSTRVLTHVPGMTAGLDDATDELGRAGRVLGRCAELAPGEETSAVLWLDYDAPDFLHEAAGDGRARDAGGALHRFQEGLRATHEGPPARQTVLGHSYGSLVVGAAARDHGLAADALVFVGSPGVGVAHASELGVPPGQVWASTAPDDVIRLTRPPDDLARQAVLGGSPVGTLAGLLTGRDDERWFGHDPADPGFGGRTFPSGRHGHTGYWEPANPALDGMARVVLGR
ncbi:Alpha/beta hydrolase [Micromonospora nigra]|uniref:Alpha/beta hydrolase n=1 Tax=Micromonospora nigra TaxID=145857 RepID=A0A1C6RRN0_9ACTN|nr:alpha/beta hydrolase [Micromonospora nigra]SCL19698.1 Alpha/beta hydrolase [Micromonospora nigra]